MNVFIDSWQLCFEQVYITQLPIAKCIIKINRHVLCALLECFHVYKISINLIRLQL